MRLLVLTVVGNNGVLLNHQLGGGDDSVNRLTDELVLMATVTMCKHCAGSGRKAARRTVPSCAHTAYAPTEKADQSRAFLITTSAIRKQSQS